MEQKDPHDYAKTQKNKASIAEIVRKLINEHLPKDKNYENNPLFSLGADGLSMSRPQGSRRHDDHIYQGKK